MGSQPFDGSDPHVVDRLAEYFSGSLAAEDEFVVETHLLSCGGCQVEYDELGEAALAVQPLNLSDP